MPESNGNPAPVWSVSEVNHSVRELVEGAFRPFWVAGEIGSLVLHSSGHAYFTLKDEKSQLRGCWFGGAAQLRRLGVRDGSRVEAFGSLTVYEVRGEYQMVVRAVRPAGLGDLQRRFEELKARLAAEGLLAPERKKPLPVLPVRIGVVTSPSGAALRDFLQIINRRFNGLHIRIYPALVQGPETGRQVAAGVRYFNETRSVDVIVVTRGGGSMEDLWGFNDEFLARTIAASRIPVISAVGHEIDFTICDFVADLRAPTPSAAAELVVASRQEFTARLDRCAKDLEQCVRLRFANAQTRLNRVLASALFRDPARIVAMRAQELDEAAMRLEHAVRLRMQQLTARVDGLEQTLETLNPRRQLERGYAMVFDENMEHLLCSADQPADKELVICFGDGKLRATTLDGGEGR